MPQATIDNTAQFKHDMLVDSNVDEFAASVNVQGKQVPDLPSKQGIV